MNILRRASPPPPRHRNPPAPPRCKSCSGSGLLTGPTGVCTIDANCPTCDGTGKPIIEEAS